MIARILMLLFIVLLLAGCSGHNTSGRGNEFKVEATIYKVGKHSVKVQDVNVVDAYGKAESWFHGRHQIHDNYNTCDWHSEHHVGHEYDSDGAALRLRDFRVDERVVITGAIRQNASSCGKTPSWKWRPVYDSLTKERGQ